MKNNILKTVVAFSALSTVAMSNTTDHSKHTMGHKKDHKIEYKTVEDMSFDLPINHFTKKMIVPPMMEGKVVNGTREFELTIAESEWEFVDGMKTKTIGYSFPILGPVLKMNKGERTKVTFENHLMEETTVHWHGAEVDEAADGVHNADILPHSSRTVEFTLNQPEATLWYHPHTAHKTASQVYYGLAGLLYLEDLSAAKLPIPKTYGVDDFPIVAQEKMLDANGQLEYAVSEMESLHGKAGGLMMVNAIASPYLEVPKGIVRLRLINGTNANLYNFEFEGNEFFQIASDGGYLERPVAMKKLKLSAGERAEVLIDTSKLKDKSYMTINGDKALELRIKGTAAVKTIPTKLVDLPFVTTADAAKATTFREITLSTTKDGNFLNGVVFDPTRIDFDVKQGEYEIWTVKNSNEKSDMWHPFHIHGTQFRIISRNGDVPPENERGWKDTFFLEKGDTVQLLVKFDHLGVTMYHCHILEHEETGMMGQFEVKKK